MATFKFKGVDDLIAQYEKLSENSEQMIGAAIYKGAGVVMGFVTASIANITTDEKHGSAGNLATGPKAVQKYWLEKSVGISKARQDGSFTNVKIGFSGYNGLKTKTWPQGQPNSMVARAVESGTSWMQKQPFMRTAEQQAKRPCEKAMSDVIDKEISKLTS